MSKKQYTLFGIDTAMRLLRPGARCTIYNNEIIDWMDPRPAPTWEDIVETLQKIKDFEDSIDTLYIEDYLENK